MKSIFRKIGHVLFCFLPFLIVFAIQLIVSIPAVMLKAVSVVADNPDLLHDIDLYTTTLLRSLDSTFNTVVCIIYAVIAALIMGFWYWKKFTPKKVPRRKPGQIINLKMVGGLLALMLGMQYLSGYIVNLLALINPNWYDTYEVIMDSMGFMEVTWFLALYSVIIAPISEELIFRGVTMHYAKKCMPFWVANILQAVLFGIFHGNVIQGGYAFVVGLFCGYVCYRGDSIYLAILYHMLFNIWGTFAPAGFYYAGDSAIVLILIFLGSIAVTLLGFHLYSSGAKARKTVNENIESAV